MRRTPAFFAGEEEEAHFKKMLDAGSAPVLIRKKDVQVRRCLDYRRLNNVTRKDVFPLPLIEECLDILSGNVWFYQLQLTAPFTR